MNRMYSSTTLWIALFGAFVLIIGCVPQKKFNEVALLKDQAEIENEQMKRRIKLNEEAITRLSQAEEEYKALQIEHRKLQGSFASLQREYDDCQERYKNLLEQNKTILSATNEEKQGLLEELTRQQLLVDEKQRELMRMESALDEREQKLRDLTALIDSQNERLSALRRSVSDALLGFSDTDLTVEEKNGRVYVTLSQNLLFPKGSRKVDKKGEDALAKLGQVMANNTDIRINVEGHTDSDGSADLNWDLSVNRATTVAKILINNGVSPQQVTASGRAYYDPVAPNDTEENKSLNRRTEIILSPRLEELMDIIKG